MKEEDLVLAQGLPEVLGQCFIDFAGEIDAFHERADVAGHGEDGKHVLYRQAISKCASTGSRNVPLIGRMSCGQAENATIRSISARSAI